MNTRLITIIICICVSLFNLYCFIQRSDIASLILFVIWLLVAIKYFKDFLADKKDKNSKNNA